MKKLMVSLILISSPLAVHAGDSNANLEIMQLQNDPQWGPIVSPLLARITKILQEINAIGENPCDGVSTLNIAAYSQCNAKQAYVIGLKAEMTALITQIMGLSISSSLKEQISAEISSAIEQGRRGSQPQYYYTSMP